MGVLGGGGWVDGRKGEIITGRLTAIIILLFLFFKAIQSI